MYNIGQKIKELRQKNDLTQEKLADYLCVSYQAVSKWETGVSNPDLSLIGPLTKLFKIPSDELLGLLPEENDENRREIEESYNNRRTLSLEEQMKLAEKAVHEYPGDMKYLAWLADCVWMDSYKYDDNATYYAENEKAVKMFRTVIENTDHCDVRTNAIHSIVLALGNLGRRDEARKYAELYPESPNPSKDSVIELCLEGDERIKHRQKRLDTHISLILAGLTIEDMNYLNTVDKIIDAVIPDGNYLYYYDYLNMAAIYKAICLTNEGKFDAAVDQLRTAYRYAKAWDDIFVENPGTYRYTTPILNMYEINTADFFYFGAENERRIDIFHDWISSKRFDLLRDREDFKELEKLQ